ncbi:MAG: peptide chain release factor N(5)-glutamine methyltransferase [Candidatus Nomurabacteria bacterium]|nr:peptide chain release factor N(5)-glutamine methyltransferase [Candidatus Nomurabacteria bacterium]USN88049.1 MAG: peptide chain release factor N(5)-glutamine methyltransferase [Candidatus Nomurabacteria bacterium]
MLSQEEEWLLREGFGGKKSAAFFAARTKLATGTPLAYLIGYTPFLNTKIYLDSSPLIPRPETEFWTEKAIAEIKAWQKNTDRPVKILDLCAGSGCIGVAVAKNIQNLTVDFIELDNHQTLITKNCKENDIGSSRFRIFSGNLFSPLTDESYDFILTNPPYIDKTLDRVETSVKSHEPELALYGGEAGLEIISKIIEHAPDFLNQNGELWIEHEPEQVANINELASSKFTVINHQDQYKTERFSQLVLK